MALSQTLSKFSIRNQILLGFAPVLLVLIFFAFISHQNFYSFSSNLQTFSSSAQEERQIIQIQKDIIKLQRYALVYSHIGYEGMLKKFNFLDGEIRERLKTIGHHAHLTHVEEQKIDRIASYYDDYVDGFHTSIEKHNKIKAIKKEELDPLAEKAVQAISSLSNHYAREGQYERAYIAEDVDLAFVKVMLVVEKFLSAPDSVFLEQEYAYFNQMFETLKRLDDKKHHNRVQEIKNLLTQYHQTFNKIVNINRGYMQLVNIVLAGKAAEIEKLSEELAEHVSEHRGVVNNNIDDDLSYAQNKYYIASVIAAIIGVISALYVAHGISSPVQQMSETLEHLAKGVAAEIPGLSRKNEMGSMARAAQEFKNMGIRLQEQAETIKESEARLSSIMNDMIDGLLTIDENGTIESYNQACERIFQYKAEEMVNKNIDVLMHTGEPNSHDTGGESEAITFGRRKNGDIFPMEMSLSEVKASNKSFFSCIIRDITDRKKAQDDLRQANAELEEFAYRTSHDLRSPLVSSIKLLDISHHMIKAGEGEKALESLDHIKDSLGKLEVLVKDILSLTQAKNMEENNVVIDFRHLIDEALQKFRHMENFERLTIDTNIDLPCDLISKESRISLIVENLVSNAIKYQDVEEDQSFLRISVSEQNDTAILVVEDNGLGIPQDQRDKLFVMFKRFHPKTSFGSGLGLYMMKKSADILGGHIELANSEKGCKFLLKIPLKV